MAKEVIVTCNPDGSMKVELTGYKGKECDQETLLRELMKLLEPESSNTQKKPEYYQNIPSSIGQRG